MFPSFTQMKGYPMKPRTPQGDGPLVRLNIQVAAEDLKKYKIAALEAGQSLRAWVYERLERTQPAREADHAKEAGDGVMLC